MGIVVINILMPVVEDSIEIDRPIYFIFIK